MDEEQGTGEAKAKKARSSKRKRQYGIHLMLTAEEDATLRAKAHKAGRKPGDILRAWIAEKEIQAAHPEDYYRNLRNIGNNLNQIARQLNSGGVPSSSILGEVVKLCGEVHKNASR